MMKYWYLCILTLIIFSCSENEEELSAQEIVNKAIEKAGGERFKNTSINFIFRDKQYHSNRKNGRFRLERIQKDSANREIRDVLDNDGFRRFINDSSIALNDSLATAYANSVNSVHYFAQLPYGLNSTSVNKELIGRDSIEGRFYYEVKVGFDPEGGGKDYEDEYLYWIDTEDFTVDYLAYNYQTNGGGVRFRKAINPRYVEGIRFADYENYSYSDKSIKLENLDSLFQANELQRFSTIKNENIEVDLGDED